ncbi:MAG TPA: hypothetical protein VMV49_10480 [Candidatus Deferrimicrobium sp.]|nr:hypothetical protein [Candidatus Deferrimicrobium sp.]
MDDPDEQREMERRIKLKKELYTELEQRLAVERKKWEKHFTLDLSNSAFLTLQDENGDQKEFILVTMRQKNGVLGKPMKVDLKYIVKLGQEKRLTFSPWISKINFGNRPVFPYAPDEDRITSSPTFLLAQNQGYTEDKIDPYNVELAGFLFVNYPKYGNFLEAVSGSVVGNVSVIEKVMQRNKEPYSRENHLLNWLYFLVSKDSRAVSFQIFNMQQRWVPSYTKYLENFKKSFK